MASIHSSTSDEGEITVGDGLQCIPGKSRDRMLNLFGNGYVQPCHSLLHILVMSNALCTQGVTSTALAQPLTHQVRGISSKKDDCKMNSVTLR